MAVSVASSGTQAATLDTDHTVYNPTSANVYLFMIDTAAMVAGDILELRVEAKVLTAGTVRILFLASFSGPQVDPIKVTVPVVVPFGANFILQQTDGTGRSYPWSVMTLA